MILIATTCANQRAAERLAQALLKARLVACVNMWPVRSVYWWQKKLRRSNEWIILYKTSKARAAQVSRRIKNLHDYTLPVIEQWEGKVAQDIAAWIDKETRSV